MKNTIKYYLNTNNFLDEEKYFTHCPHWVENGDVGKGLMRNKYTDNILLADFICIYFPNENLSTEESFKLIENIKNKKNINKNLKCIVMCKEELLIDHAYKLIKNLREFNIFTKNEIILFTSNINIIENNLYTHIPPYLSVFNTNVFLNAFLHFKKLNDLNSNNLHKDKKLIISSRKESDFRNQLFSKLTENKNLFNDDNTIRYYGMRAGNDFLNLEKYKNIFTSNEIHEKVSNEYMITDNCSFYLDILNDYKKHYFTIVNETLPHDTTIYNSYDEYQITEKTFIPMLTKSIFFINNKSSYEYMLEQMGVKTFEGLFDIHYDILPPYLRINKLIEIANKINSLSYIEINKLYYSNEIQDRINSNYELILKWMDINLKEIEVEKFLNKIIYEN